MNEHDDHVLARFDRRFSEIEGDVPIFGPEGFRRTAPRRGSVIPRLAYAAVVLVAVGIVALPQLLRPTGSGGVSGSSTGPSAVTPDATPRAIITTGGTAWSVSCSEASDVDCDGAVALFALNLARDETPVFTESAGHLLVEARPCPNFNGLTASGCWDVSAVLANGAFCMVVAHAANDPRYPDYFQIGGDNGAGRAGGPPSGWPMCRSAG